MLFRIAPLLFLVSIGLSGCLSVEAKSPQSGPPDVSGAYKNSFSVLEFKPDGTLIVKSPSGKSYGYFVQKGRAVYLMDELHHTKNTLELDLKTGDLTDRGLAYWRKL